MCQLRLAPYSYDWIDNFGRKSPTKLVDGTEDLEIGQPMMRIFDLVEFAEDAHLTMITRPGPGERLIGRVACTYMVVTRASVRSRIVVKLICRYPNGWRGAVMRALLPWGDLVMMRKQLTSLKSLAERDA
jgi:hypothetical protein